MTKEIREVLVVGGGVAAHRCVFRLRAQGYEGRLTLVCAEARAPYDRTALSKSMLSVDASDPPPLSPPAAYEAAGIELKIGVVARRLSIDTRTLACDDGSELPYDRVVLATGASAVVPVPLRAPAIHTIRVADDIPALRRAVSAAARVVIIGGGLIGCEVASSLLAEERPILLVEQGDGPLSEIVGPAVAERLTAFQRDAGVELLTATRVRRIDLDQHGGYEVLLDGHKSPHADVVVVAVGARPDVAWLTGSGLTEAGAIVCDNCCATAATGVLAAGDCTAFPSARGRRTVRLEHWDAAARHGIAAADNALGLEHEFDPVTFFWSDQHGTKLAMCGTPGQHDHVVIEDTNDGFVAAWEGQEGRTAVFGLNAIRAVVDFRRELETS